MPSHNCQAYMRVRKLCARDKNKIFHSFASFHKFVQKLDVVTHFGIRKIIKVVNKSNKNQGNSTISSNLTVKNLNTLFFLNFFLISLFLNFSQFFSNFTTLISHPSPKTPMHAVKNVNKNQAK